MKTSRRKSRSTVTLEPEFDRIVEEYALLNDVSFATALGMIVEEWCKFNDIANASLIKKTYWKTIRHRKMTETQTIVHLPKPIVELLRHESDTRRVPVSHIIRQHVTRHARDYAQRFKNK